jgi:hypothetical protein
MATAKRTPIQVYSPIQNFRESSVVSAPKTAAANNTAMRDDTQCDPRTYTARLFDRE